MELTKNKKRVIIETTNTYLGCLEQGGVCGRIDTYDVKEVLSLLAISLEDLANFKEEDYALLYPACTIREIIKHSLKGQCYRKGIIIE